MPPTQLSAVHPSPKRKRDNLPFVAPLNTTLRDAYTPPSGSPESPTAESPRNVVANQLSGMTIAGNPGIPIPPLTPTDNVIRKKPKLDAASEVVLSHPAADSDMLSYGRVGMGSMTPNTARTGELREIPETPQPELESQSPRSLANVVILAQPEPVAFTSSPIKSSEQRGTSGSHDFMPKGRPQKPHSRKKSPSPPLTTLTWQDNEITGHLVDPSTDPDDDGTGINGIGFKPTPAVAWARAQKRRQQVMEWRARETKEARAKRSERRRRGVGGAASGSSEGTVERDSAVQGSDAARRAVRFAI